MTSSGSPALRAILALSLLTGAAACATTSATGDGRSLGDAQWQLVELGGRPTAAPAGEDTPFLRFTVDSARVNGSSGCNLLLGPFTHDEASLRFGAIASTRRACAEPARNALERDFLGALEATERYTVGGDTLTLMAGERVLARLVAR